MNWPWHASAREQYLKQRIADLETTIQTLSVGSSYWRARYERLADLMLVRQVNPNAMAEVHVDAPAKDVASLGARVGKVATVLGSARGIKFESLTHAPAADIQDR